MKMALAASLFFATFINIFVFIIVASNIGGDALNGKVEGGHYFLANHGQFTEVSAGLYAYSLWHARILLLTFPFGFAGGAYFVLKMMEIVNKPTTPR